MTLRFTFEGRPLTAKSGQSIAAALAEAGVLALRETKEGGARGVFCGMGVCQDCLVAIGGEQNQRACVTPVAEGMAVTRQRFPGETAMAAPQVARDPDAVRPKSLDDYAVERPDVLIVGGGAGGLSAAATAAKAGLDVLLLDERKVPGGQYYKQTAEALDQPALDAQQRAGADLIAKARDAGARLVGGAEVWGAFAPDLVLATIECATRRIAAKAVILATGAHERGVPVPGWTLPGVMTTGAAQTLWRSYRALPGKRVLVAGNGPLNLQVAAELAEGGAEVALVAEASAGPGLSTLPALAAMMRADAGLALQGSALLGRLRAKRVPVRWSTTLERIERGPKGLVALLGRREGDRVRDATEVEVDAVAMGYGFEPENGIARALGAAHTWDDRRGHLVCVRSPDCETSVPNLFAIGDGCGLSGAPSAVEEGIIAATALAARLGGIADIAAANAARARLAKHRAFQEALWRLFAAPVRGIEAAEPDTLVCRCEHVTRGAIEAALADGAPSLAEVKRRTRIGMGRCQGRYCGPLLARHLAATQGRPLDDHAGFAPRAPVKPVALEDLVATGRAP